MASASSRRVGARLAPFTNSRSPLTVKIQWRSPTWRRPVRTRVAWLSTSSAKTSTVRWVRGCAPSDHGHHSAGLSTPNCQVTSLTPCARPWAKSRSTRSSTMVRSRTERVSAESSSACSCSTARSSWASWHTTRSLEMRTGPVRSTRTGRHRPPGVPVGVDAVPVLEDAGDVALGGPVALRVARDLDEQRVLRRQAGQVGDVVGVGDEVALGVAEVGTVEPHVALVEEPVEGQPVASLLRAALEVEAGAVDERAVARRERRHRPPVTGDRHPLPGVVVVLGLDRLAAEVVVGGCGAPGAGQVHTRRERRSSQPRPARRGRLGPSAGRAEGSASRGRR